MNTNIGISDDHRKSVASLLNMLLADEFLLYVKTRNAHWNITGPHFSELHRFFEEQYEALDEVIDEVAERVRMLGHFAAATLSDYQGLTRLVEGKADFGKHDAIIRTLLDDHETIVRVLRADITKTAEEYKDLGTSDFLTALMERHEKMAWMLRSYLQG